MPPARAHLLPTAKAPSPTVIWRYILKKLKSDNEIWDNFKNFPELYKRVRIGNIQKEKKNSESYKKTLKHFLEETKKNNMYGDWDDNGRLIDIYE